MKKKELFTIRTKSSYNKVFHKNSLAIEMRKTQILENKSICLGLSALELSKISMYEPWYDYVKPKYGEKVKLSYMDTGSFIVLIKANNIYKGVETRFDTSNFELNKPLSKGKK